MAMPDSQWYPSNRPLINNWENIVVFIELTGFFKKILPAVEIRNSLMMRSQFKVLSFQNVKHWYIIHTWPDKAFTGTVVNRALAWSVTLDHTYSPFKMIFYLKKYFVVNQFSLFCLRSCSTIVNTFCTIPPNTYIKSNQI